MTRVLINAINDNAVPRGPDRYLLELLPHLLADPEIEITLAHAPWQAAFRELKADRLTLLQCDAPRKPAARLLWQARVFPRLANRLRPDVAFLPNLLWHPGLRVPSVLVAHDFLHFRSPDKFGTMKAALLRRVIRKAVRRSTRIIAVSDFTAQDAIRFAGADPARLITTTEGAPEIRPRSTPPDKTFLFVGKLERTKGVDHMIAAYQSSPRLRGAGVRLRIIGPDGNAADEISALIARAPEGIDRLGFVSEEALEEAYRTCRGFVFPSTAEGFGLVVLEAMARGAPVIAARATSLPEVVGEAGLLVPPDDVDALRDAMERLAFDDALFEALQTAGYARCGDFSWDRAGAETAALLKEVAR